MKKIRLLQKLPILLIFLYVRGFSQQGHWDTLATRNQINGRSECGMASSNGKLYLLGGDGMDSVEVFDPSTLTWTKKSAPPVGMNHFEAVSYQNKIYVLAAF